ncbi:MAG: DUF1269 domain-containing protein [Coriobacteriia bacterium]
MAESDTIIGYAGIYANVEDAKADFAVIKEAHRESWIGTYDAALFEKAADGKVKVLDTDATQRAAGAEIGVIAGVVLGLIFPPGILVSAAVGAGVGAVVGNLVKGFMSGDIKKIADELAPGEAGVILVADATFDAGAEKLMKRAKKLAKQEVKADAKDIKKAIDEA